MIEKRFSWGVSLVVGKPRIEDRARVQLSTRNAGPMIGGSLRMEKGITLT